MTAHAEFKYYDSTDSFTAYFDYSRIQTEGRYKSFWDLKDYKSPQSEPSFRYKSSAQKFLTDCQASKYQSVALYHYSEQMAQGEVVWSDSRQAQESQWIYPPPNSIGEGYIKMACGRK
jgi:hypothetical protein